MDDLDLDLVRARAELLIDWDAELQDTRFSDAPYVTVVLRMPKIDAEVLHRLKATFAGLGRMRALLWQSQGVEIPLAAAKLVNLKRAMR